MTGGVVRWKGMVFVGLLSFVCSACAAPELPPGRVGEFRGRIVQIEREQGLIAVAAKSDAGGQWFQLAPLTSVRGPAISTVDALQAGQRVYVRYLRAPTAEHPEVLSITVLKYTLAPRGVGMGSFGVPGF